MFLAENPALARRFRAGERDALEAVYRAYVRDVARLVRLGFAIDHARRVAPVQDPDEQRDLVQEVFVRAFAQPARQAYDGLRPYRPYLLRIAKNRLIDRVRRSGREVLAETEGQVAYIDDIIQRNAPLPAVEADLDWSRQREATLAYLQQLDPVRRRFVDLRFTLCHSQAKVAETMRISRRRVMKWEQQTLCELRVHLATPRSNRG